MFINFLAGLVKGLFDFMLISFFVGCVVYACLPTEIMEMIGGVI